MEEGTDLIQLALDRVHNHGNGGFFMGYGYESLGNTFALIKRRCDIENREHERTSKRSVGDRWNEEYKMFKGR